MDGRRLRVLLVGSAGAASVPLSAWLGERETLDVAGPATTIAAARADAVFDQTDGGAFQMAVSPSPKGRD